MKSKYEQCNDIVCPYLNHCVLAEENPGIVFPCGLDDPEWQVASTIYIQYTLEKAKVLAWDEQTLFEFYDHYLDMATYVNPDETKV